MPEETAAAAGGGQEDHINRRLDRLDQKLMWEDRWWRGGLIAALVFIAIAILVAGLHPRRRLNVTVSMAGAPWGPATPYGGYGPSPPPPAWGWGCPGGYGGYGGGPGGGEPQQAPPPPAK